MDSICTYYAELTHIVLKYEGGFVDHPVGAEDGEMPSSLDLLVHG